MQLKNIIQVLAVAATFAATSATAATQQQVGASKNQLLPVGCKNGSLRKDGLRCLQENDGVGEDDVSSGFNWALGNMPRDPLPPAMSSIDSSTGKVQLHEIEQERSMNFTTNSAWYDINDPFPSPEDYELVWHDEFSGSLSSIYWNVVDETNIDFKGASQTGSMHVYRNTSETVDKESDGLKLHAIKPEYQDFWHSGKITTQGKLSFTYGRVAIRMKANIQSAFAAAAWMLPENTNFTSSGPAVAALDIVQLTGRDLARAYVSIDYNKQGGDDNNDDELTSARARITEEGQASAYEFHVYEMEWGPEFVNWYVDGRFFASADTARVSVCDVNNICVNPFNQRFYLILNLAVGGPFANNPDPNMDSHNYLQVDYVRVYRKTNSAPLMQNNN